MNLPSASEHRQPHDQLLDAVRDAANVVASGGALTEAARNTVAEAVADHEVRMVCLGLAAGCDDTVAPAAAAALWRHLATDRTTEHLEGPAILHAYAAALAEDLPTARRALDSAVRATDGKVPDEGHAAILRDLLDRGRISSNGMAAGCHDFALNGRFYLDQR